MVGIPTQIFWFVALDVATAPQEGMPTPTDVTPLIVVACVGSALLVCAVLLYVPEGIQRARQTHRDNQEFKDRFK
jgi:hypothetical protein